MQKIAKSAFLPCFPGPGQQAKTSCRTSAVTLDTTRSVRTQETGGKNQWQDRAHFFSCCNVPWSPWLFASLACRNSACLVSAMLHRLRSLLTDFVYDPSEAISSETYTAARQPEHVVLGTGLLPLLYLKEKMKKIRLCRYVYNLRNYLFLLNFECS